MLGLPAAGQRTQAFMNELREAELLMDGEVTIQPEGAEQPFICRGFQMVNEEKLQDLRGDQLRKMSKSGMLPLLYAHLFSLALCGRSSRARSRAASSRARPCRSAAQITPIAQD